MQHTLALARHAEGAHLTAEEITAAMENASVTFAGITYVGTSDKPSAQHKHNVLRKVVTANVQLFSNIKDAEVFVNAVAKDAGIDKESWIRSSTWFEHTECYSIVQHKRNAEQYLYCIVNNVTDVTYYIDGEAVSKEQYACLLTNSAADKLLNPKPTHNKTNNVVHNITPRTFKVCNVMQLNVNKQQLAA